MAIMITAIAAIITAIRMMITGSTVKACVYKFFHNSRPMKVSNMKNSLMTATTRTLMIAALGTTLFTALPVLAEDAASLNAAELKSLESNKSAYDSDAKMGPQMDRGVEGRIAHLHDQLKVMPDQEDAWGKVAAVMRDNSAKMKAAFEARKSNTELTAPEDIKAEQKLLSVHASTLSDFYDAFSTFYDKLTPDQQKHADKLFTHMEEKHEHHMHDMKHDMKKQ